MSWTWGLDGLGTFSFRESVKSLAQRFGRQGFEMRLEDFWPTDRICFRFEVEFQRLKPVVVIDAIEEDIVSARFAPTDEIDFLEVIQVCYSKTSLCQLRI